MRKSNWIIIAILAVASILFLSLWVFLGFDVIDSPVDLVVTIVWWLLIIGTCVAIHLIEKRRQRSVRTTFVAPNLLYNSEAGIVMLREGESYVEALQRLLNGLDYSFKVADVPADSHIRFTCIVRSNVFSDGGRNWKGDVLKASNPEDSRSFSSKMELANILSQM